MCSKKGENMKSKWLVILLVITSIVIITTITIAIKVSSKKEFVKPEFDNKAIEIINTEVSKELQYAEINVEQGYVVGICNNLILDKYKNVLIYFTSSKENNVYLKLRIYDKEGNILKETGLIKPGQQLEKITIENLEEDKDVIIKIMSYDPETYYSRGTVSLNTKIIIGDI